MLHLLSSKDDLEYIYNILLWLVDPNKQIAKKVKAQMLHNRTRESINFSCCLSKPTNQSWKYKFWKKKANEADNQMLQVLPNNI